MVLHGSGVGGGSLVYANTLMQPNDSVFADPSWNPSVPWSRELAPALSNGAQNARRDDEPRAHGK